MIVALIILAALVAVGLSLWLLHRRDTADDVQSPPPPPPEPLPKTEESAPAPDIEIDSDACCGMHITCEKDSLLASVSREVEYFDDEELDRFAGRGAEDYSPEEIEEFRRHRALGTVDSVARHHSPLRGPRGAADDCRRGP